MLQEIFLSVVSLPPAQPPPDNTTWYATIVSCIVMAILAVPAWLPIFKKPALSKLTYEIISITSLKKSSIISKDTTHFDIKIQNHGNLIKGYHNPIHLQFSGGEVETCSITRQQPAHIIPDTNNFFKKHPDLNNLNLTPDKLILTPFVFKSYAWFTIHVEVTGLLREEDIDAWATVEDGEDITRLDKRVTIRWSVISFLLTSYIIVLLGLNLLTEAIHQIPSIIFYVAFAIFHLTLFFIIMMPFSRVLLQIQKNGYKHGL